MRINETQCSSSIITGPMGRIEKYVDRMSVLKHSVDDNQKLKGEVRDYIFKKKKNANIHISSTLPH